MMYHMTSLLFNGCHAINNVMPTCYISLSAGTSNVMRMSVTTMQFIEIIKL